MITECSRHFYHMKGHSTTVFCNLGTTSTSSVILHHVSIVLCVYALTLNSIFDSEMALADIEVRQQHQVGQEAGYYQPTQVLWKIEHHNMPKGILYFSMALKIKTVTLCPRYHSLQPCLQSLTSRRTRTRSRGNYCY